MSITPFIDSLMLENFDIFKALITDLKTIKSTLKNENRRVNKPICSYTAYDLIKKVADPIQKVFNGRRIKDDRALELFAVAIRKVNLLVRELRGYGRDALVTTLEALEQRLVTLLPQNTPVQLELFEGERFDTGKKEPLTFKGFKGWKREYQIELRRRIRQAVCEQAYQAEQNTLERIRNRYQGAVKQFRGVVQKSIRFSGA